MFVAPIIARQASEAPPTGALLLLDKGWKAGQVADALYLDAETVRGWRRHFIKHSLRFLYLSPYSKREGHLNFAREAALKEHLTLHPPRSTNEVRAFIQNSYGNPFPTRARSN